jgi:hypothetical protein
MNWDRDGVASQLTLIAPPHTNDFQLKRDGHFSCVNKINSPTQDFAGPASSMAVMAGSSSANFGGMEPSPKKSHFGNLLGCPPDEDINTLATVIPSVEIVGPITRS